MRRPIHLKVTATSGRPFDGKAQASITITERCFTVKPAYSKVEYTLELEKVAEIVIWKVVKANLDLKRGA